MTPQRMSPEIRKLASRRKGVLHVPAAESYGPRLDGRRLSPGGFNGLPMPTEERGRRTAALLAAALAHQPPD